MTYRTFIKSTTYITEFVKSFHKLGIWQSKRKTVSNSIQCYVCKCD